jgi:hypothetical protein
VQVDVALEGFETGIFEGAGRRGRAGNRIAGHIVP